VFGAKPLPAPLPAANGLPVGLLKGLFAIAPKRDENIVPNGFAVELDELDEFIALSNKK
jgi:hypothetical protein